MSDSCRRSPYEPARIQLIERNRHVEFHRCRRRTPKGEASLLSKLRRFMPAGPVDAGVRKTFGIG
ncbi:short chain dehydrogenase [compost metagenome]